MARSQFGRFETFIFSSKKGCYLGLITSGQRRDVGEPTFFFQVCSSSREGEGRSCGQRILEAKGKQCGSH